LPLLKCTGVFGGVFKMFEQNSLQIVNISKSYSERKVVVDVSFLVKSGEVVGLLGPNGAGKTTCFYIACGLVRTDSGLSDK
jgi:lipopolysaccharide export system ATP-binding protein